MAIFEEESNASQDGNYREHLNRNWHNGNTEFADLRRLINGVYTSISSLWNAITGWTQQLNGVRQQLNGVRQQHEKDVDALTRRINDLNETIKKQDARISKLEDAVFNTVYINDTKSDVETKTSITHEINDTHVVNDDNGIIIQDEHQTLPNDVN